MRAEGAVGAVAEDPRPRDVAPAGLREAGAAPLRAPGLRREQPPAQSAPPSRGPSARRRDGDSHDPGAFGDRTVLVDGASRSIRQRDAATSPSISNQMLKCGSMRIKGGRCPRPAYPRLFETGVVAAGGGGGADHQGHRPDHQGCRQHGAPGDSLFRDGPAQQDGDHGVHIRVGGHQGSAGDTQQPDVGGVAHQRTGHHEESPGKQRA